MTTTTVHHGIRSRLLSPAGVALFIACVLALISANPLLTLACVGVLALLILMLWREGEPPVLLLVASYQWAQVSALVLHADIYGLPLEDLSRANAPVHAIHQAIWLGLGAILILALGQWFGQRLGGKKSALPLRAQDVSAFMPGRIFWLYLGVTAVGQGLILLGSLSIAQALLQIFQLRFVAVFMLAHLVFQLRQGRLYLLCVVFLEIIMGLSGFFSSFKTVFFVLLIALSPSLTRLAPRRIVALTATSLAVLLLSSVWTSIKGEYRDFLNKGTLQQVVLVSWEQRIDYFGDLVNEITWKDMLNGLNEGALRLAYVDRFAEVVTYVPEMVPHTHGELWGGALLHVLTPRVLFPDKPMLISDSEQTMKYTGRFMAGAEQGTSISMGYVAESYIDFGKLGMWIPIFLMGLIEGWILAFFVVQAPSRVVGYGLALVPLLPAMVFEMTATKYLGGLIATFIVTAAVKRLLLPAALSWLQNSKGRLLKPPGKQLQNYAAG